MEYSTLKLERVDGGAICWVRISRPKVLNALDWTVLRELEAAFTQLRSEAALRVVLLTGEGKAFVAGADIATMQPMDAAQGLEFGRYGSAVFRAIERFRVPVIAVVNGYALGGGCELAMACDFRYASTKAVFAQPEVGLGITPGYAGTQRLPRLIGRGMAAEMLYTARMVKADEALRIGLVNRVAEPEELENEALATARLIASKAPIAVRRVKEALNQGLEVDFDSANEMESLQFSLCFTTHDQKEAMEAFLQKREAKLENK